MSRPRELSPALYCSALVAFVCIVAAVAVVLVGAIIAAFNSAHAEEPRCIETASAVCIDRIVAARILQQYQDALRRASEAEDEAEAAKRAVAIEKATRCAS